MHLRTIMSGLLALIWLAATLPITAQAGGATVDFKPGAIKAALAKSDAVLLHYKSTW